MSHLKWRFERYSWLVSFEVVGTLKHITWQKNHEAVLPMDMQAVKHVACAKYTPNTLQKVEGRQLDRQLRDPVLLNTFQLLE